MGKSFSPGGGGAGSGVAPNDHSGWAQYQDGTYTDVAPFSISADTKISLPNSGNKLAPQMPIDLTDFYDSGTGKILGRNGDGLGIVIEFTVEPSSVSASLITTSIDIGGAVGEIYPYSLILDKGVGVPHSFLAHLGAFTLDTWESNGGIVKVISNGPCDIYNIRYVFSRTHKAR